ncbi:sushi, von Willebrand factor type A, EGF and pentraxin domain-containing protein 1-like [Glandiceps talaboti]
MRVCPSAGTDYRKVLECHRVHLYPYGPDIGDNVNDFQDDGSSGEVNISIIFPFFDNNYNNVWINNNGIISFALEIADITLDMFPLSGGLPIIAPFWADVDLWEAGNVFWRISTEEDILNKATEDVRTYFIDQQHFMATWVLVATWDAVGFHGTWNPDLVNTFQAVLVTNGRQSFALFNYGNISWTTGTASGGDPFTGLGGTPAQVGFNSGSHWRNASYAIDTSGTDAVVNIANTTNVGVIGRYAFRLDEDQIIDAGCDQQGSLTIYPYTGSMLGGEEVLVAGPCFDLRDTVVCKFGERHVVGVVLDSQRALCTAPVFYQVGRLDFDVSIDGGETYNYHTTYTVFDIEQIKPGIIRVNSSIWHTQDEVEISWDVSLLNSQTVDVHLLGYHGDPNNFGWQHSATLATNYSQLAANGRYRFDTRKFGTPFTVGAIRVSIHDQEGKGFLNMPGIWTDVHDLYWNFFTDLHEWCGQWYEDDSLLYKSSGETTPCPSYLSHYLASLSPWFRCCIYTGFTDDCRLFFDRRPSDDCKRYEPPRPATMFGDPHAINFDGTPFTFNGYGEFDIARISGNLTVQGRMVPFEDNANATVFKAFAIKGMSTATIHIERSERRNLDAYISTGHDARWELVNFEERLSWYFEGLTISKTSVLDGRMMLAFDNGISINVSATGDMMAILLIVPTKYKYQTTGLLGSWNDDTEDDFRIPSKSEYLSSTSSLQDIYYNFGLEWRISVDDSLFRYKDGESYEKYNDVNYEPVFIIPVASTSQEVSDLCGDSSQCVFDYVVTGDRLAAASTLNAIDAYVTSLQATDIVVTCDYVTTPQYSYKIGLSYVAGSIMTFECIPGYTMDGPMHRRCLENGSWDGSQISCEIVTCKELESPVNGTLYLTSLNYLSIANFTCDKGFNLVGSHERMCAADGNWTGQQPVCNIVTCEELHPPQNGTIESSNQTYLSMATIYCDKGFTLVGSHERMCAADGNWTGISSACNIVTCEELEPPENGTLQSSSHTYLSAATISCDEGFTLVGSHERMCTADGKWTGQRTMCDIVTCEELRPPKNGSLQSPSQTYLSVATISCDEGFTHAGSHERMCTADGNWTGQPTTCNIVTCEELQPPMNGSLQSPSQTYLSVATISCDEGFTLVGSHERICTADGNWTGHNATCDIVTCEELQPPMNGTLQSSSQTYLSAATISCDEGFTLVGSHERICTADGNWTGQPTTCNIVTCEELQSPTNGTLESPSQTYLSVTTIFCDEGFTLIGSRERMCTADGNWTGQLTTCNIVTCEELQPPKNGTLESPSQTYLSVATISCDEGFTLVGSHKRMCTAEGNWTGQPTYCNIVTCEELEPPKNGTVQSSIQTYLSVATISCDEGFTLEGSHERICTADGNWTGQETTCNIVTCEELAPPKNGTVQSSSQTYLSVATISCDAGFTLVGSHNRMCTAEGNWTGQRTMCDIVTCEELGPPTNGTLKSPSQTYLSVATISCDEGFTLVGSHNRICTADGNWTGQPTYCSIVTCEELEPPKNGTVQSPSQTYLSVATISCHEGFTLIGSHERMCTADGNWTGHPTLCHIVTCEKLQPPKNGSLQSPSQTYLSVATISCDEGFTLVGSHDRFCTADGNWTGQPTTCNIVTCEELDPPTNGKLQSSSQTYLSMATISCDEGFTLVGSHERMCTAEGNWTGQSTYCNIVTCEELQPPKNGSLQSSSQTYLSVATISCDEGFTLVGAHERICTAYGNWTGQPTTCNVIACEKLQVPKNGSLQSPSQTYLSMATISCDEGFTLAGSRLRMCAADGNWTGQPTTCNIVTCEELEPPKNGTVQSSSQTYLSVATISCDEGFALDGSHERICTADRNWTGKPATCDLIICEELESPKNGSIKTSSLTYHSMSYLSCDKGFTLVGSSERMCAGDGKWTGERTTCNIVVCEPIQVPSNGTIYGEQWTYNSIIRIQCSENFKMNGTNEIRCQADGKWSDDLPSCYMEEEDDTDVARSKTLAIVIAVTCVLAVVIIVATLICIACVYKYYTRKAGVV